MKLRFPSLRRIKFILSVSRFTERHFPHAKSHHGRTDGDRPHVRRRHSHGCFCPAIHSCSGHHGPRIWILTDRAHRAVASSLRQSTETVQGRGAEAASGQAGREGAARGARRVLRSTTQGTLLRVRASHRSPGDPMGAIQGQAGRRRCLRLGG